MYIEKIVTKAADAAFWMKMTQYVYLDNMNSVKILDSQFLVVVEIMTKLTLWEFFVDMQTKIALWTIL